MDTTTDLSLSDTNSSPPALQSLLAASWDLWERTVAANQFIRQEPTERQSAFLLDDSLELLYGGAAGGGKSSALLMSALQFVHEPTYSAILLRRTYADLALPGALIPRSHEWLSGTGADWNEQRKVWTFPSGATIQFGYCETPNDIYRYQGSEFQFVGIDELTQWPEEPYRFLFSRLRRLKVSSIPLRMRAGSNPGGVGHEWVKKRFIRRDNGRWFVPAKLDDNPHIDADEYDSALAKLDPITRRQLRLGDWDAIAGGRFQAEWFRRYRPRSDTDGEVEGWSIDGREQWIKRRDCALFITVDPAATVKTGSDYTAMGCFATNSRDLLPLEVIREKIPLDSIVQRLAVLSQRWKPQWIGIEAIGFQSGLVTQAEQHRDIRATIVPLEPRSKEKLVRATPAILLAESGRIFLPEEDSVLWLDDFVSELRQYTGDPTKDGHDDQVDMLAYAVLMMQEHYSLGDDDPMVLETRSW